MDIEYPGFGTVVVEGNRFDHDVVIVAGEVRARDKGPSKDLKSRYGHTPLTAGEAIPWSDQGLLIGSGYSGRLPIADDVVAEARERHVDLVAVPTAEACDRIRQMDPGDVYAVLHVTC